MKLLASQKIKTGALVLVGFILLVLAIFFIGSQKNLFDSTFKVQVKYANVSGLQAGNFVRFTGINVGTVESIRIINDSTVNVTLALQKHVQKFIKKDAYATIGSDGLMGDKIVIIEHGSPGAAVIGENDYLEGENPVEMSDILARMGDVADNATILTGNLAEIVYKVNNGEGSLGRLLNSDQLARNLEGTVASTQQTVQSIKKGAEGFSENMEAVKNNFLFRGYFKRREKKRIADSIAAVNKARTRPAAPKTKP
ncbi:MlaD family protein [Sediminibacterium soli]|uniref:MlaD family protein n=1 Tax=Sediminibacterium soli TaxID=2698829 RepID=UPI00137A1A57|nr:MlaD family protein [Sediminibacterium soli]NCI45872.1 MCE family protein [Sediminibacterium soli]